MSAWRLTLLLFVSLILAACSSKAESPNSTPLPGSPTTSPIRQTMPGTPVTEPEAIWTIDPAKDPVDLEVTLESGVRAEAFIPVEGGTLSVTGRNGAEYTLTVPADALLQDTRIAMTPVESLNGLPFSGGEDFTYAVRLEPEGLAFHNFVTLTIHPPEEIEIEEQIFFGYQADGQDMFLALPDVDSREVKMRLMHFSGYGVTKGLLSDIEPVRSRLGGTEETRLTSAAAELLAQERQRQLNGGGDLEPSQDLAQAFEKLVEEYVQKVVEPRVAAAGESCAAGRLAIQTVLGLERQRQLLGMQDSSGALDSWMDRIDQIVETAGMACLEEEYEMCAQDHIIHRIIPVWLSFEREIQLFGGGEFGQSPLGQQARQYVDQCLRFDLEFESTARWGDPSFGYESNVRAIVPVKIGAELDLTGHSVLVNEHFEAWADFCTSSHSTGDGAFDVLFLSFDTDFKDPADQLGFVKDIHLGYLPGSTGEQASLTCENGDTVQVTNGGAWNMPFLVLHEHEMVTGEAQLRYDATGWTTHGGELFAERSWQYEANGAAETGSFKLYHRPGE